MKLFFVFEPLKFRLFRTLSKINGKSPATLLFPHLFFIIRQFEASYNAIKQSFSFRFPLLVVLETQSLTLVLIRSLFTASVFYVQLFRERLSYKRLKPYPTISKVIMSNDPQVGEWTLVGAQTRVLVLSPSLLLNHLKSQSSKA